MRGFIRRHEAGCFWTLVYGVFTVITEIMTVTALDLPYDPGQLDWQVAVLWFAPSLALIAVIAVMVTGLVIKTIMRLVAWAASKARAQH